MTAEVLYNGNPIEAVIIDFTPPELIVRPYSPQIHKIFHNQEYLIINNEKCLITEMTEEYEYNKSLILHLHIVKVIR